MDEYERLYYERFYAFEFTYGKHHLSKSRNIGWYRYKHIQDYAGGETNNDDVPMFVKCRVCNKYMSFSAGYWYCKKCGARVREKTIYNQLDRENREFGYDEHWDCDDD